VLGRAVTFALVGLEPRRVEVEAHLRTGQQPTFSIVGLADRACQEAKHPARSYFRRQRRGGLSAAPGTARPGR